VLCKCRVCIIDRNDSEDERSSESSRTYAEVSEERMDEKGSEGGTAAGAARQRGRGSGLEGGKFSLLSNFPYAHPGPEKGEPPPQK
jgi:hypothetical protein